MALKPVIQSSIHPAMYATSDRTTHVRSGICLFKSGVFLFIANDIPALAHLGTISVSPTIAFIGDDATLL